MDAGESEEEGDGLKTMDSSHAASPTRRMYRHCEVNFSNGRIEQMQTHIFARPSLPEHGEEEHEQSGTNVKARGFDQSVLNVITAGA